MTTFMKAKLKKKDDHDDRATILYKKLTCLKWTYGLFDQNYGVAMLYTLYLTVSGIIIPNLRSIG